MSSVSSTWSFEWNFGTINIWTNCQFIWSRKVYIWLSVWEFQKLFLWQPCLNKGMYVENWETDQLQHDMYVDISHKFTLALAWVSGLSGGKGERWKRKRERAEGGKRLTQMLLLEPSTPHSMIRYHPIKITSGHWVVSFTCQKARLK